MNCLKLFITAIFTTGFVFIASSQTGGIRIDISHLRSNDGHVLISLFKDGSGYPDDPEKAVRKAKISIKENTAWVVFTGLPAGEYAVAVLHDENDDQKMNKNIIGLPKEGYGFSNNAMGTFGPPSFSSASFAYNGNGPVKVGIRTRY